MRVAVLAIAAGLDYWIGDPKAWPHPVQAMGWGIGRYSRWALQSFSSPRSQRWAGVFLAAIAIAGSGGIAWALGQVAASWHWWAGAGLESVLLASCFAGRSLRDAARDVLQPLQAGDLLAARSRLSQYVGRDTDKLPTEEVLRAVLETVTENATDGVMAPLFYGVLGSAIPGIGALPLTFAYKAASTLDSMVGYREAPYTHLGWCSAKVEDGLTWLPCRLTVLTVALLSGTPQRVLRICQRDAIADPSPNAGWSECAYAAALGVQMGGINWYRGTVNEKPRLGDAVHPIRPEDIQRALQLTRYSFLIWLLIAIAAISFLSGSLLLLPH